MSLKSAKRIVIKMGSALVADEGGKAHSKWLEALAADVKALRADNKQVILVSSGAVALGRQVIGLTKPKLELEQKQATAACGQILLMNAWAKAFEAQGISTGQILLTAEDSESRKRYINARNTLETLLKNGIIPIINENDTVATAELKVGDNDRLAARVAQMISADLLILLSDIDGLYTADPSKSKTAKFIADVPSITDAIEKMAGGARSNTSSGGMRTKIDAAKIATQAGCDMIIASGKVLKPLSALLKGAKHTYFHAGTQSLSARKHWIVGSLKPSGSLIVDNGAKTALGSGKSLLPAGVVAVKGKFQRGDAVFIEDEKGQQLAKGITAYGHEDVSKILRTSSKDIEKKLGKAGRAEIIHRDDLVLTPKIR